MNLHYDEVAVPCPYCGIRSIFQSDEEFDYGKSRYELSEVLELPWLQHLMRLALKGVEFVECGDDRVRRAMFLGKDVWPRYEDTRDGCGRVFFVSALGKVMTAEDVVEKLKIKPVASGSSGKE